MDGDENGEEEKDDERLEDRAERQYGLFTLAQAGVCGVSPKVVYRRISRGRYVPEQPRVFSLAGAPHSWERSVLAACLSAGPEAVASHRAAARIWGLLGEHDDIIELTVPRGRLPR